ncbi:metallophosphoesterase [Patescibacteria group bacterium AH-259-L07]|nr:metallophosphoesterase [Patescibacteria group bacterium AH-259-L07]
MFLLASIIFFILIILLWYSVIFEPYHFKIENVVIKIKNLPRSFEGTKIIQLSDIHTKRFGRKEKAVLRIIQKLKPDYVVITGDLIDRKTKHLELCKPFWQEIGRLYQNRIFATFGNHLHANKNVNVHEFENILQQCGIDVLVNESRKLERDGEYIYLVGVDDPRTKHHNLKKALQQVEDAAVTILLAHSAEIMEDVSENQVDLILSGHSHGGQVKFPFIRPFWDPTIYHGKYNRGLFKIKDYTLYVNRGIGTSLLPIRFNSSPEITVFELRRK